MAVCRIIDTGATPDQYDQVRTRLGVDGRNPPPGATIHIAAQREDGTIRIIEVWDSRDEADGLYSALGASLCDDAEGFAVTYDPRSGRFGDFAFGVSACAAGSRQPQD